MTFRLVRPRTSRGTNPVFELKLLTTAQKTKYPVDAFIFVQQGLDSTVHGLHHEAEENPDPKLHHISGTQLCHGLRDFAIDQYGLMARTVLQRWSIHSCEDFGHIVFALVDASLMLKTDEDSIDDFIGVYDFSDAFTPKLSLK